MNIRKIFLALIFAGACSDTIPELGGDLTIEPNFAVEKISTPIRIHGSGVFALFKLDYHDPVASTAEVKVRATLDDVELTNVQMVDRGVLSAVVPPTLSRGMHTLTITDAFGRTLSAQAAFRVDPDQTQRPPLPTTEPFDYPMQEPIAQVGMCGDGHVGSNEACDDGNFIAEDGCAPGCVVESGYACAGSPSVCAPICGDGRVIGKEACDDMNTGSGDGCSPSCTIDLGYACSGEPSTCTNNCGDGELAGAEACDDMNLMSGDGCSVACAIEDGWSCPDPGMQCVEICGDGLRVGAEACDDHNLLIGDGCTSACTLEQGWMCDEPGSPCTPICGDGMLRGSEPCDDSNTTDGDGCSSTCAVEPGFDCLPTRLSCHPVCGDGLMRSTEACDDHNLAGGDGCSASCTLEQGWTCPIEGAPCVPICGDGIVRGAESCDDTNANDNDGCSALCRVELGWNCPVVGSACVPVCGDGRVRGTEACDDTNGNNNDGCSSTCTIELGWNCPLPGQPCITVCGDGRLRGTEGCDDGNVIANDGCSPTCTTEQGYSCPAPGFPCVGICGDGLVRGGEICDDHNTANNDGCSSVCLIEDGWSCVTPGNPCAPVCGDHLARGSEACDDGNLTNGDGCSSTCTIEQGFACPTRIACAAICGDGLLRAAETCDDGNTTANDGCTAACAIETGWTCPIPNTACLARCGDNLLRGTETCDDGNVGANDGCSPTCQIESGWACPSGFNCAPICGDALRRGSEACDDGNLTSGDGCSATCSAVESGYSCPPSGGPCSIACGDGLIRGAETCDDGNASNGDGCGSTCNIETSFDCYGEPSACVAFCGNRRFDAGEGCDDGNRTAGDGCNASCAVENNFVCAHIPSICVAVAGTSIVDDGAACPGTGTSALPYCTINNAVAALTARIIVRPGEYREAIDLNGRTVDIIADDGALLIPSDSASTPALRIRGASTVNVTGLTITGGTMRVSFEGGIATITGAQIGPGGTGTGIETSGNAQLTLLQSRVSGNPGGGVLLGGSRTFTLSGDVISGNGAATGPLFGGVRVTVAPAGSRFINDTVVYNTAASGATAGVRCDVAGATMISSVVYGNLANTTSSSANTNCSPTYSSLTPSLAGTGNITGDPQLLAPNYSILQGSPLVNTGDLAGIAPAGSAPAFDFDDIARVAGNRPDMGAYEYNAARYVTRTTTSLVTVPGNYLGRYPRGLYRASNWPTTAHFNAGTTRATGITPRAMNGTVDLVNGRYALLALGGSDAGEAFCTEDNTNPPITVFPDVQSCTTRSLSYRWHLDPVEAVNRDNFYPVNGAYPNQYAENFTQDDDPFPPIPPNATIPTANGNYDRIRDDIFPYYVTPGLSEAQVEALWIELYNPRPQASLPDRHSDVTELIVRLGNVIRLAKVRYPNLQLVFLTSRPYAGVSTAKGPGEPFAYETGLAIKALVEAQMAQMENAGAIVDARAGNLDYSGNVAPWIGWGPYWWANGTQGLDVEPRWTSGDYDNAAANGYFSNRGEAKAEIILIHWFTNSPFTKCWIMDHSTCS